MKVPRILKKSNSSSSGPAIDPGFGTKLTEEAGRLINKDGSYNIVRHGKQDWTVYQHMTEMSWYKFFGFIVAYYVFINLFFAVAFMLLGVERLQGIQKNGLIEDFSQAFFFSIQTFTTVGYGAVSPIGVGANLLASLDALIGLISTALATGLFFARFSKAQIQLAFSENILIAPYLDTGLMSLQFRIANKRESRVMNLKASLILSWVEKKDGKSKRIFKPLSLEREKINLLPLNWTIVHIFNEDSPVQNWTANDFIERKAEIIIFLEGYDESFAQQIHITSSYTAEEIIWNARFEPMYFSMASKTLLKLEAINHYSTLEEKE